MSSRAPAHALEPPPGGAFAAGVRRARTLYGWLLVTSVRRRDLVVSAAFSSVLIAIITAVLGGLWIAALPGGSRIAGYDAVEMVWYLAVAEAVVNGVDQRLMVRIGEDLRRGDLETELLRPVVAVWMLVSRELGRSVMRFALSMPACVGVAWLLVGPPPSWAGLLVVALAGPLATVVQMLLIILFASSALWIGDTTAAWFLMQKLVFLLGGMLLPLEVWPGASGAVLAALPFGAAAYTPARLAVHPSLEVGAALVALQLAWIAALACAAAWAWGAGERRLVRGGGGGA